MAYYLGMDVSQKATALCVVDGKGLIVAEGKALTNPQDIVGWIATQKIDLTSIIRAGLEAGAMSNWLCTELVKLGLPVICLEAFQAHQFLKTQRNKTDKNDARGLAHMVRMGEAFIKEVVIRSQHRQELRTLLTLRQQIVSQRVSVENNITGALKPFGLVTPRRQACLKTFQSRVYETLCKAEERNIHVRDSIVLSLSVHESLCKELASFDKLIKKAAADDPVCRRLMTAPGVGPVVACSFVSAIDDPKRFRGADDIGAYFGLTPRQYQSGETDVRGSTSRRGNTMTRTHLVQAATTLLIGKKCSALKAWGLKLARKKGFRKARIAVARKLAVVLHKMWVNETEFCWTSQGSESASSSPA